MDFRLLVNTTDHLPRQYINLEGRKWTLSDSLNIDDDEQVPPFACVSYRWGSGREPNALFEGYTMSTHACTSLAAAVRVAKCNAFWTDVFCVPHDSPARQPTLENMGYIYSRAAEVVIVLREETFSVIENMLQYGSVTELDLRTLETDEWVSSIWTYQEIVNGGSVRFVSERQASSSLSIECADFFNALGFSLHKWKSSTNSSTFATLEIFPNLNVLEDTLADWQIGSYAARSALSIFSNMASKRNEDPANYYYAIFGVLTSSPQQLKWDSNQNLDEKLMDICEHKNDYSFIYTMAPRDTDERRLWRPKPASLPGTSMHAPPLLRPVFAWHSWGEAQNGHHDAAGFWLHGMTVMKHTSTVGDTGKQAASAWLSRQDLQHANDETLGSAIYEAIFSAGFEGESNPITVTEGYVFPSKSIDRVPIVKTMISNQIRWTMGAPGLIHIGKEGKKEYVPCTFIGSTKELIGEGQSVLL